MKKFLQIIVFTLFAVILFASPVKAEEDGVTVYFYNSLGWENVYVYSWTAESNAPELTSMEAMEKKNWYTFTFAENMGKNIEFLFYNGEWGDTNQTQNLVIKNGKDMEAYFNANVSVQNAEFYSKYISRLLLQ